MIFALAFHGCVSPVHPNPQLERFSYSEPHMGTLMRITLYAETETEAASAAKAAFARIADLDSILSDYNFESELMRLTREPPGEPVAVSPDLFFVLERSQKLAARSNGAFDVTAGPLTHLWRNARRNGTLPSATAIAEARNRTGHENLRLDSENRTATLLLANMKLDLGGIAKGYAADEALRILRENGFPRALIAAAGDVAAGDPPPGETGWRVGVDSLESGRSQLNQILRLNNRSISTSGDTEQFVEFNGIRYSHILDPRTGLGLTERISVTVVGPDTITTDSLATLISILGIENGLAFAETEPNVEAKITVIADGKPKAFRTSGFPD